jgi:hypothetical protein
MNAITAPMRDGDQHPDQRNPPAVGPVVILPVVILPPNRVHDPSPVPMVRVDARPPILPRRPPGVNGAVLTEARSRWPGVLRWRGVPSAKVEGEFGEVDWEVYT